MMMLWEWQGKQMEKRDSWRDGAVENIQDSADDGMVGERG